jgi:hypothetical protein
MTIRDTTVIDAASEDVAAGEIILSITDGFDWDSDVERAEALQEKINTYISFVHSGQIKEQFPAADSRRVVIQFISRFPQEEESPDFVRMTAMLCDALAEQGIALRCETLMALQEQVQSKEQRSANNTSEVTSGGRADASPGGSST